MRQTMNDLSQQPKSPSVVSNQKSTNTTQYRPSLQTSRNASQATIHPAFTHEKSPKTSRRTKSQSRSKKQLRQYLHNQNAEDENYVVTDATGTESET